MKKILVLLIAVIAVITVFALLETTYFASWLTPSKFHTPIFTAKFDATSTGTTIKAPLHNSYDVKHGFFLVFPCDDIGSTSYSAMGGVFRYTFFSGNKVLESKTMSPPPKAIRGYSGDMCDLVLFTFDLPYKNNPENLFLEVAMLTPVPQLAKFSGNIQCKIAPVYWSK